jgi:hypothetical protein
MEPTRIIDDLFIALLEDRDGVNTPLNKEDAVEIISLDPKVVTAWKVKNSEFARTLSEYLIIGKVQSAVSRRLELANKQKGHLPLYYYHDASQHTFRLYADWKLRQEQEITIEECPTPENFSTIKSLFTNHTNHKNFSRNTAAKFREGVIGICGELCAEKICMCCRAPHLDPITLEAAHLNAKSWFGVLGFEKRESFDVFNGVMLCKRCHVDFDNLRIHLAYDDSGLRWTSKDINSSVSLAKTEERERLYKFIDLRNTYLQSCNPMKTKE